MTCFYIILSVAGFQYDTGGVQFPTERADGDGEEEVGDSQVSAKDRHG